MARRKRVYKKIERRDSRYDSALVGRLIGKVMLAGKRSLAESIVYKAIDLANEGTDTVSPLEVLTRAIENAKPRVEVKSRRVGGATYQVPLEVARAAVSLFPALELVVTRGNSNAVTDGMVGTMLARSAVLGALFNVRVNLGSIHDAAFVEALDRETRTLQEQALRWERQILGKTELAGLE